MYNKLKQLRLKNNYSQQHMADLLNMSKVFYYHIESGKRRLSYHNAIRIAQIFNLKPDELFYEDAIKNNK